MGEQSERCREEGETEGDDMKDEGVCEPSYGDLWDLDVRVIVPDQLVYIYRINGGSSSKVPTWVRYVYHVPNWYPIRGFEQEVPFANSRQNPKVPNVTVPFCPSAWKPAFKKYTDLKYGTQKETIPRRTVAARVARKPGVAGPISRILEWKVEQKMGETKVGDQDQTWRDTVQMGFYRQRDTVGAIPSHGYSAPIQRCHSPHM
jgi:hypothetical protein